MAAGSYRISDELRFALSEDEGRVREVPLDDHSLARVLARHLDPDIPGYWSDITVERILVGLLDPLEKLLTGKMPKNLEAWARAQLIPLTKDLNREQLYGVLKTFGWARQQVEGRPRFDQLAKVMRDVVVQNLGDALVDLLGRWRKAGIFDVTTRNRKMSGYNGQVRADRATTPRYTPPGRT